MRSISMSLEGCSPPRGGRMPASAVLLTVLLCGPLQAGVVEYTDRTEWERAVKHFTPVRFANEKLEKNVPLNAGLITIVATGTGSVGIGAAKDGTLSLSGSGTTAPWFRHTITINGGKVCAVGWDFSHPGYKGMYKSVLTHDGGTIEKIWPENKGKGFLGYIDTKGKTISGFWFGSTGRCNFTGAGVENICLSNLQPPPGLDSVPPEWAAFDIQYKATWDQTLAANTEQQWQKEFATGTPALKSYLAKGEDAVRFVIALRKIRLLKAMIERFPDEKAKHAQAHKTIAQTSREMILPWWPDPESSPLGALDPPEIDREITTRWEALAGAAKSLQASESLHPDDVQGLLNLLAQRDARLQISPWHFVSYRLAMEDLLEHLSASQLARVRAAQEEYAVRFAGELARTGDFDEAARLSRRAPWARSVHELLLDLSERALQQGRCQWAMASLNDLLDHADDPEIRHAAQAARWVAMARQGTAPALHAAAMAEVPDETPMPWRGGTLTASAIKKALLGPSRGGEVALADLARKSVQLPAGWPGDQRCTDGPQLDFGLHTPWPISQVQATDRAIYVMGAARVARFNADGSGPLWTGSLLEPAAAAPWDPAALDRYIKSVKPDTRFERRGVCVRGETSSALSDDGRFIYRLVAAAKQSVVALSAADGQALWSTAARDDWRSFMPMSRPAAADGRVYVLAVPAALGADAGLGGGKDAGPAVLWRLVCADGRDGRVLWTQPLSWQPFTLLDSARGAGGVAIYDGWVYCSTSMGIVARCDVRDGALDWVRGYASTADVDPQAENFSREGSAPLLSGQTLLLAPRDHTGVMAMRCDSGQFLWETMAVPSDRLIAVSGNVVLAVGPRRLCALDLAGGRVLWSREFPQGTLSQGALAGGCAIVTSAGKLHRIAISTGQDVESVDLQPPPAHPVVLEGALLDVKAP
ncbi:MAG: PQQ-binding-like beta-propeller repeat protein [Planctomycetaceae bacterium]|nr:PQQ-like beta-propeller repeat protein [Planctomycetaceae bacterium]